MASKTKRYIPFKLDYNLFNIAIVCYAAST